MTTPNLCEKALLVKLTSHKPSLFKRQDNATAQLQALSEDKAATAYVKLFKFRTPVHDVLARHRDVLRLHQRLTLPYEDRGARLLPNAAYFDYTTAMRTQMDAVADWFTTHRALYPTYVGHDCAARGWRVQPDHYPTSEQFEATLSHQLEFTPMPQLTHFLFDLSAGDRDAFRARQDAVAAAAATEALNRVRKPLDALLTRLQTYAGQPGQRFHGSLLVNVTDGLDDCERLLFRDLPPDVADQFMALRVAVSTLTANLDLLRDSAPARATTAALLTTTLATLETL